MNYLLFPIFICTKYTWSRTSTGNIYGYSIFPKLVSRPQNTWKRPKIVTFRHFLHSLVHLFGLEMEYCNLRFVSVENRPWVEYLLKNWGILFLSHASFHACKSAKYDCPWLFQLFFWFCWHSWCLKWNNNPPFLCAERQVFEKTFTKNMRIFQIFIYWFPSAFHIWVEITQSLVFNHNMQFWPLHQKNIANYHYVTPYRRAGGSRNLLMKFPFLNFAIFEIRNGRSSQIRKLKFVFRNYGQRTSSNSSNKNFYKKKEVLTYWALKR